LRRSWYADNVDEKKKVMKKQRRSEEKERERNNAYITDPERSLNIPCKAFTLHHTDFIVLKRCMSVAIHLIHTY
jgi:hypothetical protein